MIDVCNPSVCVRVFFFGGGGGTAAHALSLGLTLTPLVTLAVVLGWRWPRVRWLAGCGLDLGFYNRVLGPPPFSHKKKKYDSQYSFMPVFLIIIIIVGFFSWQ